MRIKGHKWKDIWSDKHDQCIKVCKNCGLESRKFSGYVKGELIKKFTSSQIFIDGKWIDEFTDTLPMCKTNN